MANANEKKVPVVEGKVFPDYRVEIEVPGLNKDKHYALRIYLKDDTTFLYKSTAVGTMELNGNKLSTAAEIDGENNFVVHEKGSKTPIAKGKIVFTPIAKEQPAQKETAKVKAAEENK